MIVKMTTTRNTRRAAQVLAWLSWSAVCGQEVASLVRRGETLGWEAVLGFGAATVFAGSLLLPRPQGVPRQESLLLLADVMIAALSALVMVYADPRSFACALLVISAWESALLLPLKVEVPFVAAQTSIAALLMLRALPPSYVVFELALYLAFQGYAVMTAHVARQEALAYSELKTAQQLLLGQARSAERLSLARELHDVAGHRLSGLIMKLESARHRGDTSTAALQEAEALARASLEDIRGLVSLTRDDSRASLRELLTSVARSTPGMEIDLDISPNALCHDPEQHHVIMRTVQEAATNALRHSGCRRLKIVVARNRGALEVIAADDGSGAPGFRWGQGLKGMRERIEEVGGTLKIVPDLNPGFALIARLPFLADQQ